MNFVSLQTSQIERRSMPAMGYITHTVSAPTLHGKTVRFSHFNRHYLSHYLTLSVWWINCTLCIILSHNCRTKSSNIVIDLWVVKQNSIRLEIHSEDKKNPWGFRQLEESSEMHKVSSFLHENRKKKAAHEFKNIWLMSFAQPGLWTWFNRFYQPL